MASPSSSAVSAHNCFAQAGPKISVIVPVYNMAAWLPRCLDSLLCQSYRNLEILLVNDGSTDDSARVMQAYAARDARIRCVTHPQNRGLFQARITGVEQATGQYIAFVDSDDWISIDWYRTLLRKAEQSQADIVVGEWCYAMEDGKKSYLSLDPFRITDYDLHGPDVLDAFMEQTFSCFSWHIIWNKLYRKTLWDACAADFVRFSAQHGPMVMWEDVAFSSALWAHAGSVVNVHGVNYFYFRHAGAATSLAAARSKEHNERYVRDASAALRFMKEVLQSVSAFARQSAHYAAWQKTSACLVYQELVGILRSPEYEQPIREAFAYHDAFEPTSSFFYHLTAPLGDAFAQQEEIKRRILSPQTQLVSFDVFDTLIQRPFLRPTDLFSFLNTAFNRDTSAYVDFARIRTDAEASCREQKAQAAAGSCFDEVTLDEIYAEIARTHLFVPEKLAHLKQLEMDLEIRFCEARPGGQDLYQLAQDAGKRIILCTDMYLPRTVLEAILDKNQYAGYEKLYLSSEIKVTKAQKTLYLFVQKDLGCVPSQKIFHIGDNYVHDVENARACGWSAAHLNKAGDLLQNTGRGTYSGECFSTIFQNRLPWQNDYSTMLEFFPDTRSAFGLVANRLFGSPFVSYAPQSDFNGSSSVAGYATLGPHLLALSHWLQRQAQQRAIPTIHFVARDGYLPKQAFDLLNTTATRSNYIRLSRRALLLADVDSVEDLYSLSGKIIYSTCTPHQLGEYLAPIIPAEKHAALDAFFAAHDLPADRTFDTVLAYERCLKLLIENAVDLSLLPAYQAQLRAYFAALIHPGDYIFDVGYNGRAEAALSHLLGFPVGSLYLHVSTEVAERRQTKYHCPCACFYPSIPAINGLMREQFIMEPGPSTIGYAEQNGVFGPVFEPYREEYSSALVTRVFQKAALDYVRDFQRVFGEFRQEMVLHEQALSAPYEYYQRYSKPFDREMFATLTFEDTLGRGDALGFLAIWNQWTESLDSFWKAANPLLPDELRDLYANGLFARIFIKSYHVLNRLFPKGGRARAAAKKLAGIVLH